MPCGRNSTKDDNLPDDDKVNVYIDGSNLYHSLRTAVGRSDLDFQAFAAKLVGERRLHRIYYYNAVVDQFREPDQYRSQQSFFDALRRVNYLELKFGRLVYRDSPTVRYEKGIDVKIATDMLVHGFRGNYDVAILVSGDTDFADAVQAVKDLGRHVEVALFDDAGSIALRDVADRVHHVGQSF